MSRVPRPNVALIGTSTSKLTTGNIAVSLGRKIPYQDVGFSSPQLILPEVISWPFSVDEAGVSFPSGLLGIKTVSYPYATEKAWGTGGSGTTDQDLWIAVPDTLPSGWSSRVSRDHNKGRVIIGSPPFFPNTLRGTPYHYVDSVKTSLQDGTGKMADFFLVNGDAIYSHTANYRPTTGGLQTLSFFPGNCSQRTTQCAWTLLNGKIAAACFSAAPGGSTHDTNFPTSLIIPKHVGWRNIRMYVSFVLIPPTTRVNVTNIEFIVGHKADNSDTGTLQATDVIDFRQSVSQTAFTDNGDGSYELAFDTGPIANTDKVQRGYWAGYVMSFLNTTSPGTLSEWQTALKYRLICSPRVDIPFWFTSTGAGMVAPGGI